jgi:branched-chain amino acid aminotransferase
MEVVRGDFFFLNGSCYKADQIGSFLKQGSVQVYEVFRIISSKAIFFNDHIERLKTSILGTKNDVPIGLIPEIIEGTKQIAEENNIEDGNIKILVQILDGQIDCFVYFIPHLYPQSIDYEDGVSVGLFKSMRKNPNVKAINLMREEFAAIFKKKNLYELLLVNDHDEITEGSRSNIFFIDFENNIHTAPDDHVLKGVTRKYIIHICEENQIPITLETIKISNLKKYKSAFLTGTSPKILPIKNIENITFDVKSPLMVRLMQEYEKILASK